MIKIRMNQKYVIKSPITGNPDFDQIVADYRDNLLTWGCTTRKDGECIEMELCNGVGLDVKDYLFIMTKDDADVIYYNPFVKVDLEYFDSEVPSGLPNSSCLDENNDIKSLTWRTWRGATYEYYEIDGYFYFKSNTFGNTLTAKELLLIHNSEGVELVDSLPKQTEL